MRYLVFATVSLFLLSSAVADLVGLSCKGKSPGAHFQYHGFELECSSPESQPKLVACLPPELNGERLAAGETMKASADSGLEFVCESHENGTFAVNYRFVGKIQSPAKEEDKKKEG
jgi:hypothetical protein